MAKRLLVNLSLILLILLHLDESVFIFVNGLSLRLYDLFVLFEECKGHHWLYYRNLHSASKSEQPWDVVIRGCFNFVSSFIPLIRLKYCDLVDLCGKARNLLKNTVNKRMHYFTKCITFLLFRYKGTLILILDANPALYCIQRQIGYSMYFSCDSVALRKIWFAINYRCRLVFF